jgi:hypothetical protein
MTPRTCHDDSDYVIRAHDADGKTVRLPLNIHPAQARMLDYLANTKGCGLQTTDAVARWCISWGIYTLFGPLPNTIALMVAKMNIFQDERFEAQKDCLSTSVHKYLIAGNIEAARRVVSLSHEEYSQIRCDYWRARWLSTLEEPIDQLRQLGVQINPFKPR